MSNFNVNITPDVIKAQMEAENQKKKTFTQVAFDVKNYLNVRLGQGETSKTLTIRLLPFSESNTSPFEKVHMHTIKVNKEISESGWKTFVCPVNNHMGDACPFCQVSDQAKKMRFATTSDSEKQKYKDIENMNRSREMWICRCIERGHEEDGVKFWLIPNSKDGAYAKIMGVWTSRWTKAQERGNVNNIFDLNNGKDLDITISRSSDGKNVIAVVDSDEKTPLTENYEQGLAWIKDSKKWSDVYKVKPYEYMEIIVNGGVPVFSKEKNCYVDRDAENAEKEERDREDALNNYTEQPIDYTKIQPENITPLQPTITPTYDDIPF